MRHESKRVFTDFLIYLACIQAEHRSITPFPYWDLPLANLVFPRLRYFHTNLTLLDNVLKDLIDEALRTRNDVDVENLQRRDMNKPRNPSLLRYVYVYVHMCMFFCVRCRYVHLYVSWYVYLYVCVF
ncbi:hypothetical protein EON63_05515 [archaeon]|nr:MAG: hypothetical protein EON63_05515 [archaeon]